MFGIGFTEILLIAIIAILFLGPDKLPSAMVSIAKFIRSIKGSINEARAAIEEEVKLSEIKDEALSYKKEFEEATEQIREFKNINIDEVLNEKGETQGAIQTEPKMQDVELKRRKKSNKKVEEDNV